jgi:molybdenum cofactor biosynthesis enzyme MoaA
MSRSPAASRRDSVDAVLTAETVNQLTHGLVFDMQTASADLVDLAGHLSTPSCDTRRGLLPRRIVRTIGAKSEMIDGREFRRCNVVEFDGRRHIVSHRAILTVVVVSTCNAGCKFCSNEITFTPAGRFLKWNDRTRRMRDFALVSGVNKVAYTGGEPTLNPQALLDLAIGFNPGFVKSRLHTNGFGLFRPVETVNGPRELLPALIDVGLTGVSISIAHHEQAKNKEIMRLPKSWDGMQAEGLCAIAAYASARFTPRLSCVMTTEGVNDVDSMFDYMRWGRELGFRRFIFRTCSEIQPGYKKATGFTDYNDDNRMSVDTLADELARVEGVERTFRQRKSDSKVDVYRWRDLTFDVDESSEEEDPDEKVRRLILMPNQAAYTSWIDPMSVLFEDDMEAARRSMAVEFAATR